MTVTTQDTLSFRLYAYQTLPQETVKITVSITMLVSTNQTDQASLRVRIREVLARFIPDCNWVFSVLDRGVHPVAGYERINLEAAARVPSNQNYNLNRRAQLASIEGLSITDPRVDYNLPTRVVNQAVADLRKDILRQAQAEAADYRCLTQRDWRIGSISFGWDDDCYGHNVTSKGAMRQAGSEGLEVDDPVDGLSGAQQISLRAEVRLHANPESFHGEHYGIYPDEIICIK